MSADPMSHPRTPIRKLCWPHSLEDRSRHSRWKGDRKNAEGLQEGAKSNDYPGTAKCTGIFLDSAYTDPTQTDMGEHILIHQWPLWEPNDHLLNRFVWCFGCDRSPITRPTPDQSLAIVLSRLVTGWSESIWPILGCLFRQRSLIRPCRRVSNIQYPLTAPHAGCGGTNARTTHTTNAARTAQWIYRKMQ